MTRSMEMDRVLSAIRSQICPKCPKFSADPVEAARCQGKCDLIAELPQLVQIARLRDPMLRDPARSLLEVIDEKVAEPGHSQRSPIRRFRAELAALVTRLHGI